MKSTHRQCWFLCGMFIIVKSIVLVLNIYPLGNQESLPFSFLLFLRILITPRLFSYSSLNIWYGLTIEETCSLRLLSLL